MTAFPAITKFEDLYDVPGGDGVWARELGSLVWKSFSDSYISPQSFGAVGDGDADDTIPVQTAIDESLSASPQGATVFLPAGIYKITSPLIVRSGVTIIGTGPNSEIMIAPDTVIDAFDSGPNGGAQWASFINFAVNCNMDNNPGHNITSYRGTGFVGSYSFCVWDSMDVIGSALYGWDFNCTYRGDGWPVGSGYQNNIRHSNCASVHECIRVHWPVTDSSWGPGNSLSAGHLADGNIVVEGGPHRIYDNHFHGMPIHNVYSLGAAIVSIMNNIMEQAQHENIYLNVGIGGGNQGWAWKIVNNTIQSNAIDASPGEGNPGYGDPIPNTYDSIYLDCEDGVSTIGPIIIGGNGFRTTSAKHVLHVKNARHIQILGNMMSTEDLPAYMQSEPFLLEGNCSDIEIGGNSPSNAFSGTGANRNYGSATIPHGSLSVTVNHLLGRTPSGVQFVPTSDHGGVRYWYTNLTSTTFDIVQAPANGADNHYEWEAWV